MIKILAIDDKKDNLITFKAILNAYLDDCQTLTCQNGIEGIGMAKSELPDTILLDVQMPGINGYEVCQILKKNPQTSFIPIILITAFKTDAHSKAYGLDFGADAYLTKPIEPVELVAQVKAMVRLKKAEEQILQEKQQLERLVEQKVSELRQNEKKYRLLAVNSSDLIWSSDFKLKSLFISPSIKTILGYEPEEFIQIPLVNVFYKESMIKLKRIYKQLLEIRDGKKSAGNLTTEVLAMTKSHDIIWLECHANLIIDDQGKPSGILGVGRDVTKRKKAEEELILAKRKAEESDRLKSAFLANMSHEIRTPLNGILGFTSLLTSNNIDKNLQKKYTDQINNSADQLLNIISDIIDISKIEAGLVKLKIQPMALNNFLDDLHLFIREFKNRVNKSLVRFNLNNQLHNENLTLYTDQQRLNQVLINLLTNSIKFTKEGTIELQCYLKDEQSIEFCVKDTGQGIPENMHSKIFERFSQVEDNLTRTHGGNGLGLAICKSLIEMMGGKIWMESEINVGSQFYFTLPLFID